MGTLRELADPLDFHLAKAHPHPRDTRITFKEAGHVYYIDGEDYKKKGGVSVTGITGKFFPPFDADKIIGFIMKSAKWSTDPEYQYYKKSVYEIKLMWEQNRDEACTAGTKMHADVERWYNKLPVENDSKEWGQFIDFTNVKRLPGFILEPYRSEWMIFDEQYGITGALDMIFKTGEDTYAIYDWKRCKEIKLSGGEKCTWPMEHLRDNNFTKYSLQLSTFALFASTRASGTNPIQLQQTCTGAFSCGATISTSPRSSLSSATPTRTPSSRSRARSWTPRSTRSWTTASSS